MFMEAGGSVLSFQALDATLMRDWVASVVGPAGTAYTLNVLSTAFLYRYIY